MKTYKLMIFAALTMLCACSKTSIGPDPVPSPTVKGIQFQASGEVSEETRTSLSGLNVLWQENDSIKVFSNTDYTGATAFLRSGAGTSSAVFDNKIGDEPIKELSGSVFYACFPAGAFTCDEEGLTLHLNSSVSRPDAGGFGPEDNPSFCCANNVSGGAAITMSNLCGLVKVALKGTITLTELKLTLDKNIAGDAFFSTPSVGGKPAPKISSNGSKTITLHCNSVQLNDATATDFYFVVPANSYESINLVAVNDKGIPTVLNKPSFGFSVSRAGVTTLTSTLPADGVAGSIEVMTEINYLDANSGKLREELDVVSFNIKEQSGDEDLKSSQKWSARKAAVYDFFNNSGYPVIGTQECEYRQKVNIIDNCSAYSVYGLSSGRGKDESGTGGPWYDRYDKAHDSANYIFYKSTVVKKISSGTFWLSSTPSKVSKFSNSNHYRACCWILFELKSTGQRFYFFNTHLDNSNNSVRGQQLDVLWAQISSINTSNLPMVLTGDMNMTTTNSPLETFKNSGKMVFCRNAMNTCWDDAHKSFNDWGGSGKSNIDHISFSNMYKVKDFNTDISTHASVQYISDHYPIIARLVFNPVN